MIKIVLPLVLILVTSPLLIAETSILDKQPLCDRIFAQWYTNYFFDRPKNKTLQILDSLNHAQKQIKSRNESQISGYNKIIRKQPINDQARLALLAIIAIPFDGEMADKFENDIFGDSYPKIAKILDNIDDKSIESICTSLNISDKQNRIRFLHDCIKKWGSPNFKPAK